MSEEKRDGKLKLLLHSCCGPCSTAVIERLLPRFDITVFFYNPNITDEEEYEKRKETQIRFLKEYNRVNRTLGIAEKRPVSEEPVFWFPVNLLEGPYDVEKFYHVTEGLEEEPEGGARCTECIYLRLSETAKEAKGIGFDCFATTLSVSPHKNYDLILQLGKKLEEKWGVTFLAEDFKKQAGYQRSIALSKEYGLYRQNYCGCCFSQREQQSKMQSIKKGR